MTKAGICLGDITDHLPVFFTVGNQVRFRQESKYFRDFSHFDNGLFFKSDLEAIDFNHIVNEEVNESMNNIIMNMIYKGKCYTDRASVAHQLNTHFINVGRELADKIPQYRDNADQYIKRPFWDSFSFRKFMKFILMIC